MAIMLASCGPICKLPPSCWLDFTHLRRQLPLARVLEHLGLLSSLRGRGAQRRGPCPVHASVAKGRTFSVHLEHSVFHCFDAACGSHGDVIDLWAAVKHLPLRDAALDLVRTFGLEPAPPVSGTEKRHGSARPQTETPGGSRMTPTVSPCVITPDDP